MFLPVGNTFVGAFGNLNPSGTNTDTYTFDLGSAGSVSGFVGSLGLRLFGTDLDFTSVTLNGTPFAIVTTGSAELRTIDIDVPAGLKTLSVGYTRAQRFSSYGGALTFTPDRTPAVPEPASWAMMIGGFALVGGAMRYRRRSSKIAFA